MLAEPQHESMDRLSASFDELLNPLTETDSEHDPAEPEGLLGDLQPEVEPLHHLQSPTPRPSRRQLPISHESRALFVRSMALLCACSLSIGSHYATNILGPLKSRLGRELGTSHTEFGLLMSAYSLNSTWTPLVGGVLASRLGTTFASILATGVILIGQGLLLLGDIWGSVRLMTLGLFVFGLGVSPLAVVQETIIVRFFKSHGLGMSMAFGLIAGKFASFISARTSYPLTERFGGRAPFYVATSLATLSVVVNLIYIASSKWLVAEAGAELEAPDITEEARRRRSVSNISDAQALERVAEKRKVHLRQVTQLGDVFWAYVGLNVVCGMIWSPFTHLASNIIEKRYKISEEAAANQASYLLAGSVILYPICGYMVDRFKHRPIVIQLLLLSSFLTMNGYLWFAIPPSWTMSAMPGIVTFATGHGFAPLLLVVLVPKIVPMKYVSTALGVHKSLEQTGSTIFQTLAGLSLDTSVKKSSNNPSNNGFQHLLNVFLFLNVIQFLAILALANLQRRRNRALDLSAQSFSPSESTSSIRAGSNLQKLSRPDNEGQQPLLEVSLPRQNYLSIESRHPRSHSRPAGDDIRSKSEVRRGEAFAVFGGILILSAWILFLGTAWFKLGNHS